MTKPLTQQQKAQWDLLLDLMTTEAGFEPDIQNTILVDWGPDCSGAQYLLATEMDLVSLWETCDMIGDPMGAAFKVIDHSPFISLNLGVHVDDDFEDEGPCLTLTGTLAEPEGDADVGFHHAVAEAIHNRDGWQTFKPEVFELIWARLGGSEYPDTPVPKATRKALGI